MHCRQLRGGFMCGSRQRAPQCGACKTATSTALCDHPLVGAKAGKTCDMPLCGRCRVQTGPDRDLCPAHAKATNAEPIQGTLPGLRDGE